MTLSIVAIMAYIWLRFGTIKYGTATVVAMIHDTLLVSGFMGLAHLRYEYTPLPAKAAENEPVRGKLRAAREAGGSGTRGRWRGCSTTARWGR